MARITEVIVISSDEEDGTPSRQAKRNRKRPPAKRVRNNKDRAPISNSELGALHRERVARLGLSLHVRSTSEKAAVQSTFPWTSLFADAPTMGLILPPFGPSMDVRLRRAEGSGLPSAIAHIKDIFGDRGCRLWHFLNRHFNGSYWLPDPQNELRNLSKSLWLRVAEKGLTLPDSVYRGGPLAAAELSRPSEFEGLGCLLLYRGQTIGEHVDGHGRCRILYSVGCTYLFECDGRKYEISSGDAVVFNPSSAHAVRHAVGSLVPGTAPPFMPFGLKDARYSVDVGNK
ncbi:hypothetical protein DFJ74DRAFT_675075 [Hyaloraphidium curvatum]|nr:hypothetical protein DFJ74DRAFT_675075 [Hyaloraphidium curvatum]